MFDPQYRFDIKIDRIDRNCMNYMGSNLLRTLILLYRKKCKNTNYINSFRRENSVKEKNMNNIKMVKNLKFCNRLDLIFRYILYSRCMKIDEQGIYQEFQLLILLSLYDVKF